MGRLRTNIDLDAEVLDVVMRRYRQAGVTPRGLTDCVVAAVAVASSIPVLSCDRDLARIAEVIDLELDSHSVRS